MGLLSWLFPPLSQPDIALTETFLPPVGGYYDPDANLSASQGGSAFFRSLSRNLGRDLSPVTQERSQQIAYWLFESNPLAKTVLELTKDFVLGEGITIEAEGADNRGKKELQQAADRFWNDSVNKMDAKLHAKVLELSLWGEQCYSVFVNPKDGHVRLGYIDPGLITNVITDRENIEVVEAVVLSGADGSAERRYRVVRIDENAGAASYGRMVGVTRDPTGAIQDTWQDFDASGKPFGDPKVYAGACFYFAVNKVTAAKRGRSDLLVIFDWIDVYDQILMGEADRGDLLKLFVWDVTLAGMNDSEISAYAAKEGQPKPGTTRYHNDKVTWNAVSPDLKSADVGILADLLLSYIAAGARLPKTWLSGTIGLNKATAGELAEPAFKRLAARQRFVKAMIGDIMVFVFDQAELAGKIPRRTRQNGTLLPQPWLFRVVAPEMRGKDLDSAASSVNQVTQALTTAIADKIIDVEVAQNVLATLLAQFGVEVDLDALRERLANAANTEEAKREIAPYGDTLAEEPEEPEETADEIDGAQAVAAAISAVAGGRRNRNLRV